jgi:alkylhydroperoxidase/carboxymuconolactone decarboxylase family protein YurZ
MRSVGRPLRDLAAAPVHRRHAFADPCSRSRAGQQVAPVTNEGRATRQVSAAAHETTEGFFDLALHAWSFLQRDHLDLRTRLLILLAVDATVGANGALQDHIYAALNIGITREEIAEAFTQVAPYVGLPPISKAFGVLRGCAKVHEAPVLGDDGPS